MKFRIAKPETHINMFNDGLMYYRDVARLYDVLPDVLDDMGIEYKILYIRRPGRRMYVEKDSIYLGWHNHGTLPNIWHLNTAYMPNYFYFDRNGYGPWSEIAKECNFKINPDIVRKDVNKFCKEYIESNQSRVKQPATTYGIPDEPYVLVLGQRPDDALVGAGNLCAEFACPHRLLFLNRLPSPRTQESVYD